VHNGRSGGGLPPISIVDLRPQDERAIRQIAALLVESFAELWPEAWPTLESALDEVEESFDPERLSRVAFDADGAVLGWIGGIPEYDGRVWEVHPLVVAAAARGRGLGRALVDDLERQAAGRSGLTLWLGTDDESNSTSLAGADLYQDTYSQLASAHTLRHHPLDFYRRIGFTLMGVVPDANGPGKPDLLLARPIRREA
jgi:aminoglycoside 6'-N-acetyltransferase I